MSSNRADPILQYLEKEDDERTKYFNNLSQPDQAKFITSLEERLAKVEVLKNQVVKELNVKDKGFNSKQSNLFKPIKKKGSMGKFSDEMLTDQIKLPKVKVVISDLKNEINKLKMLTDNQEPTNSKPKRGHG